MSEVDELSGQYLKLKHELSELRREVYERCVSITIAAESAMSVWEKDASNQELIELLKSIKFKSQFLLGYSR